MANANSLDDQILDAIRAGNSRRVDLMAIDSLRLRTWAVVAERLNILTKRRALVATKAGWRIAAIH